MDLLDAILEPIAEGLFGFFFEGFNSTGEEGSRIQTLFGNDVWWNAPQSDPT